MYSLPNQISLDPRVCIVKNEKFQTTSGITEVYKHLKPFRAEDYVTTNPNPNKAYIMNIYLNFEFIIECLNNNLDERGDISIFEFLKAICDRLNVALGGINNLEPIINETSNTLSIIDTTPIPGLKSDENDYTLQLYGYNSSTSNFVRKVDLKTAITPEYATMITVGATADGYVKGTEATAFSKWNDGLIDRFKEKFIPGNENSAKEGDEDDEAASNYTNKFLSAKAGSASRYGFKGNLLSDDAKNLQIDPGAIEKNISVVTEYYKYLIASQKNQQGGTIGFIPFKLNFSMDGMSGIKIYNKLHVDTRFLPTAYGNELDLIVTGVNHKLSNDDWETDIETTLIPKTSELKDLVITAEVIVEDINNNSPTSPTTAVGSAIAGALASPPADLIKAMKDYGITDPLEQAHFLAQCSHESGVWKWKAELWGPTAAQNTYDTKLGNKPGEGKKYKGRGYIQLTGRVNYESYNKYLKDKGITDDVLANPDLVATKYAADVSAYFWKVLAPAGGVKKFSEKAKQGSSIEIINKIGSWVNGPNPPLGKQSRIDKFNYYWGILQKDPKAYS